MDYSKIEINSDNLIDVNVVKLEYPAIADAKNLYSLGEQPENHISVYFSSKAALTIDSHAQSRTDCEVGGFLVGQPYKWGGRFHIEIIDAIPASAATSSILSIEVTYECWKEAFNILTKKYENCCIVGWYHTHPVSGVFFSSQDIFVHRHFFVERWMVALVLAPNTKEVGLFIWGQTEEIIKAKGFRIASQNIWK